MRKVVLGFAAAALVLSCKKVPQGGNSGVLRADEGIERYDSHEVRGGETHGEGAAATAGVAKTAVEVDVNGTKLKANKGGLEEQIVGISGTDIHAQQQSSRALLNNYRIKLDVFPLLFFLHFVSKR